MIPICGPYEVMSSSRNLLHIWRHAVSIKMTLESSGGTHLQKLDHKSLCDCNSNSHQAGEPSFNW